MRVISKPLSLFAWVNSLLLRHNLAPNVMRSEHFICRVSFASSRPASLSFRYSCVLWRSSLSFLIVISSVLTLSSWSPTRCLRSAFSNWLSSSCLRMDKNSSALWWKLLLKPSTDSPLSIKSSLNLSNTRPVLASFSITSVCLCTKFFSLFPTCAVIEAFFCVCLLVPFWTRFSLLAMPSLALNFFLKYFLSDFSCAMLFSIFSVFSFSVWELLSYTSRALLRVSLSDFSRSNCSVSKSMVALASFSELLFSFREVRVAFVRSSLLRSWFSRCPILM